MKKIVIFGASDCGNVGDDLIGVVLKKFLEENINDVKVILTQQHKREKIVGADLVIIGGGGLLYDYDLENVDNYVDIILRANHLRIPVYVLGIGVQHIFHDSSYVRYREAFEFVKHIHTRAEDDTQIITSQIGYPLGQVITSRDIVFLYDDVYPHESMKTTKSTDLPTIVLALADWKLGKSNNEKISVGFTRNYEIYKEYLKDKLPILKDRYNIVVVQQAVEDEDICTELVELTDGKLIKFDSIEDSRRLIDIYRHADLAITGRYHGLIAGIIGHTPTLGVSFSGHKQEKLIKDSFPSLAKQLYTVESFVDKDILGIIEKEGIEQYVTATHSEYKSVKRVARRLIKSIRLIRDDLSST